MSLNAGMAQKIFKTDKLDCVQLIIVKTQNEAIFGAQSLHKSSRDSQNWCNSTANILSERKLLQDLQVLPWWSDFKVCDYNTSKLVGEACSVLISVPRVFRHIHSMDQ